MSHKHWPPDHPNYEQALVCSFRTKAECDANWRVRRGEAVRLSKEGWEAIKAERDEADRTAGERHFNEHAARYAEHVKELMQREPARGTHRGDKVQGVRLPRKPAARPVAPVGA